MCNHSIAVEEDWRCLHDTLLIVLHFRDDRFENWLKIAFFDTKLAEKNGIDGSKSHDTFFTRDAHLLCGRFELLQSWLEPRCLHKSFLIVYCCFLLLLKY